MGNELTEKQQELYELMSDISEDCYCAGGMMGNEYAIWGALTDGDRRYGMESRQFVIGSDAGSCIGNGGKDCRLFTKDEASEFLDELTADGLAMESERVMTTCELDEIRRNIAAPNR